MHPDHPGRTRLLAGAVLAVAAVAAAVWWAAGRAAPADANLLALQGNVDIRQVSLAFDASERIVQMLANEGDRVVAGQVLARLDTQSARLRLAQSDAQVAVAEQALARLQAGSRPEEIAQASADAAAAEADAKIARVQADRLRQVRDATQGKGVGQQDLDNALARESATDLRWQAARAAAKLVALGPRKEDIAQAAGQLVAARAQHALLARDLEQSELKAPLDAVVRSRLLEPGDMASPQRPAYTLAITHPKWVRAYVAEGDLPRLRPGMAASVSIDGAPGARIPGTLGYIASVAEFTPKTVQTTELRTNLVYEIRVDVQDDGDRLRLGMPATVELQRLPAIAASAPRP